MKQVRTIGQLPNTYGTNHAEAKPVYIYICLNDMINMGFPKMDDLGVPLF